jgi:hypothetical protein
MRAIPRPNLTAVLAVLLLTSPLVRADDPKDLQQKLESKYTLTTINAEGGVVISGVTLTLKKGGLTAGASSVCTNDYKDGKLALVGASKTTCAAATRKFGHLPGISMIPGIGGVAGTAQGAAGNAPTRPFVAGEKLWVTKIEVRDVVIFSLISDTINNATYKAEIRFQPAKAAAPDLAQADQMIAELFTVTPPDNQQQSGQQAAPAAPTGQGQAPAGAQDSALAPIAPPPPPQDQLAPIPPPPPPPDQPAAPPQTVSLGLTIDQVVAILGQPATIADLGSKKIYTYKNPSLKITFVNGKVTDMQ